MTFSEAVDLHTLDVLTRYDEPQPYHGSGDRPKGVFRTPVHVFHHNPGTPGRIILTPENPPVVFADTAEARQRFEELAATLPAPMDVMRALHLNLTDAGHVEAVDIMSLPYSYGMFHLNNSTQEVAAWRLKHSYVRYLCVDELLDTLAGYGIPHPAHRWFDDLANFPRTPSDTLIYLHSTLAGVHPQPDGLTFRDYLRRTRYTALFSHYARLEK